MISNRVFVPPVEGTFIAFNSSPGLRYLFFWRGPASPLRVGLGNPVMVSRVRDGPT